MSADWDEVLAAQGKKRWLSQMWGVESGESAVHEVGDDDSYYEGNLNVLRLEVGSMSPAWYAPKGFVSWAGG